MATLHVRPIYQDLGSFARFAHLGDGYLRLQISSDNKTWTDAIVINMATAAVSFPSTGTFQSVSKPKS